MADVWRLMVPSIGGAQEAARGTRAECEAERRTMAGYGAWVEQVLDPTVLNLFLSIPEARARFGNSYLGNDVTIYQHVGGRTYQFTARGELDGDVVMYSATDGVLID